MKALSNCVYIFVMIPEPAAICWWRRGDVVENLKVKPLVEVILSHNIFRGSYETVIVRVILCNTAKMMHLYLIFNVCGYKLYKQIMHINSGVEPTSQSLLTLLFSFLYVLSNFNILRIQLASIFWNIYHSSGYILQNVTVLLSSSSFNTTVLHIRNPWNLWSSSEMFHFIEKKILIWSLVCSVYMDVLKMRPLKCNLLQSVTFITCCVFNAAVQWTP